MKLRYIFEHYGEQNQLNKLKEELNELIDEINDIENGIKEIGNDDFIGETADAMVMCSQFRLKYKNIDKVIDYKINRQIGRIKKEVQA